jgi:uncharacterized metal-binding protein YceD (DUF177 family)
VFSKKDYIIEFNKLVDGQNEFTFNLNRDFVNELSGHASDLVCNITANLVLTKRPSLFELHFQLDGELMTTCDRCLKDLELPVVSTADLIIKISEYERYDDDEIVYVTPQTIQFDVSQFLYDTLLVSLPIQRTCEMANETCEQTYSNEDPSNSDPDQPFDPRWEQLKKLL